MRDDWTKRRETLEPITDVPRKRQLLANFRQAYAQFSDSPAIHEARATVAWLACQGNYSLLQGNNTVRSGNALHRRYLDQLICPLRAVIDLVLALGLALLRRLCL